MDTAVRSGLVSLLALVLWVVARQQPAVFDLPPGEHETRALAAGDVDGDGDPDLVLGNVGQTVLWCNAGGGRFRDETARRLPKNCDETNGLALVDLDGDGDLDLFLANGGWLGGHNRLWLNDGKGRFRDASDHLPYDYTWTNAVAAGDVDGDGDVDLLLAKFNRSSLYANDGKARFTEVTEQELPDVRTATQSVVLADIDGDGDLDVVLGDVGYECNRLWWNDGHGRFTEAEASALPSDSSDTMALTLGDVDGDGDPDLVCGNGRLGGEQPRLYRNDAGRFTDVTAAALPAVRVETRAVLLVDADGDGDLDLLLGNADGQRGAENLLWRNDGHGRFAPGANLFAHHLAPTTSLLAVDLDGDGSCELVIGNGREGGARSEVVALPRK